jgi:lipopolysaccharide export system ATP-binding protein
MSELRTISLKKRYRARTVVQDVSLSVKSGEVVGLLGPNGAGKTTSFYMIVGLVAADGGEIFIDDQDTTHLPIHRRARLGLAYLPQEASIFRRLTVSENIMAVLELQGYAPAEMTARLEALLNDLHITHPRQPGHQPVRRRAPPRGDRPCAGHRSALHPAGRAVCRG